MKAKNNSRKGFTIVELVIVIAVVAVLAAVLIPTFVSLVSKANNSADVQMVTNINKYLAAMEVSDGKNITMGDAVKDAEAAGYKAALLTASNEDNKILWDMKNDRFLVVNGKKIVAGLDKNKIDDKEMANYWVVSPLFDEENNIYSIYYIGKETNITLTGDSVLGFDVGDAVVDLTYGRTANDVVLNGVFKSLTVSGTGKPTVHGYVYQLSGNVNADGAVFHDNSNTYTEVDGVWTAQTATVSGTATFGVCYDDGVGKCYFCKEDMCKHVWDTEVIQTVWCERIGLAKSTCTKEGCGKVKYDIEAELGHDAHELEAIAATCTTAGQTGGWVCLRCGDKLSGGEILFPLGHDFNGGENCIHPGCTMTKTEYLGMATRVTQDSITNGEIDLKGKDKRMELITVILDSDVEISADKFCELFGTSEYVYWLEKDADENAELGGSKEMEMERKGCYGNGIYALDLILNGYELKINGDSTEVGIGIYGNLRIWGRDNDKSTSANKNGLVLHGKSQAVDSLLFATEHGTAVAFDSINVTSTVSPVHMSYLGTQPGKNNITLKSQTLTIQNSSLKFEDIVTESTLGQEIRVYFTLTPVDGESEIYKEHVNNHGFASKYFATYKEITVDNETKAQVTLFTSEDNSKTANFYIEFYMKDANDQICRLPLSNYFDLSGYGYNAVHLGDGEHYLVIYSCKQDIKDEAGNSVSVRTTGSGEWYLVNTVGDNSDNYVVITNSTISE